MPPSTFYNLPPPWDPKFAIPRSVMAEPPERGVMVTQWLPRGTISEVIPDYHLGVGKRLLGRPDAGLSGLGSLAGSSLAGSTLAGSCFSGGSSLSGDSLGALGADAAAPAVKPTVVTASAFPTRKVVAIAAVAVGAWWLLKKRKKRR